MLVLYKITIAFIHYVVIFEFITMVRIIMRVAVISTIIMHGYYEVG